MTATIPLVRTRIANARRLNQRDLMALGAWGLAHISLLALTWPAAWVTRGDGKHSSLVHLYQQWDANILQGIAAHGYYSPGSDPHAAAFFPGYPMALALVHLLVRNWVASELLLSLVAGGFAMVGINRLAQHSRAAVYLVASPAAIFLMVGYTESLFLACTIWSWLYAQRWRWGVASLLASCAALTRVNGLFFIAALAVYVFQKERGWAFRGVALLKVLCATAAPLLYACYLRVETGDWAAWMHAEKAGWGRTFHSPVDTFKTTYWAAFKHPFGADYSFMFQMEMAAMGCGLALFLYLLAKERWGQALYCFLTFAALGTSTWYESVPRALLLMFPLVLALTEARPWAGKLYLAVCTPLAFTVGLIYLSGNWAG